MSARGTTGTAAIYPRISAAGEACILVELADEVDHRVNSIAHSLTRALMDRSGVVDAVPGYASVLVEYDPLVLRPDEVEGMVRSELAVLPARPVGHGRLRIIPTAYGGEYGLDLAEVARQLHLSEQEVVRLHSSRIYRVYMLGFAPGFAYMGELPEALSVPRLSTPRSAVPAGSVGIAGRQTGIYPSTSPGGWRIIGRTSTRLFDPLQDPPAYLAPGDRVRFIPVHELDSRPGSESDTVLLPFARRGGAIDVLTPGLLTLVQDLGRHGWGRYGVPPSGALDWLAARVANYLVGNPANAALLEMTFAGPTLRFRRDCLIAIAGGDMCPRIDGEMVPGWTSVLVKAGQVLRFHRRLTGMRAYLAVAGGIQVPLVLDSRSTFLRGRFGGLEGRALRAGDLLEVGQPIDDWQTRATRSFPPELRPHYSSSAEVRVVLGPHLDHFPPPAVEVFLSTSFTVAPVSDRMGYRLLGPAIVRNEPADVLSCGMPLGGVQVPPDGQPIVLMSDHQTTGGYPLIATVARADLPILAQLAPGDSVRFRAVSPEEARAAYVSLMATLQRA